MPKPGHFLCFKEEDRTTASTKGLKRVRSQPMLGRIAVSLMLVVAILIAQRSASATCVFVNAPNQKVCGSPCCATTPCCATSEKRDTGSVPFTTSTSQQNFVASTPVVSDVQVPRLSPTERSHFPEADVEWHSPETLALLCIRLN